MAIGSLGSCARLLAGALIYFAACAPMPAWSREAASTSACQSAANTPAIVDARAALDGNPADVKAYFKLADAWSDAGCFNDAVRVLQAADNAHLGDQELATRLRVARSLVGEEHFFDNLDRADAEARLKRARFRCTDLADLDACSEALRLKPDDPVLLVAQGDLLVRAKRPGDALNRYRLAAVIAPGQHDVVAKIASAEAQRGGPAMGGTANVAREQTTAAATPSVRSTAAAVERAPLSGAVVAAAAPTRRYSNSAPEAQSH